MMGDDLVVSVAQGKLRGKKTSTKSGGPFVCFQGIPYAKPPIGLLRFMPPQPPEPWTGIRDAVEEGPDCLQLDMLRGGTRGKEDCLYLNVYTQELQNNPANLKPVMVWIHGGGFVCGSGSRELYGVDHFVDMGVIAVTFNYRLGPLGFLTLNNDRVPGNMGLKDQSAALRWVQKNIASFGGDSKNVTLFGESAGGASVHYHLLSPMSKGLFSKAIAQSGSAFNPWTVTYKGRERAIQLGEVLGCKTNDSGVLLNHLKAVDGEELIKAASKVISDEEKLKGLPLAFVPNIEPTVPGQGGFLTREPSVIIRERKFHQVPFIAGVTSHEGMLMIKDILNDPSILNIIDGDFEKVIPSDLRNKKTKEELKEIANKIKKFYWDDKPLSTNILMDYINLNTDSEFLVGVDKMVSQQAALSSAPVYYYQFTFDGNLGYVKKFVGATELPGACHGDELGYLFTSELFDVTAEPNSPDEKVQKRLIKLWTNFAKTGNPTPELDDDITVKWPPYTASNPCYLRIDSKLSVEQEIEKRRMAFWNDIYNSKL